MRCIAIDPGASTGWAIFDSGALVACGACAPPGMAWGGIDRVVAEMPQRYPHDTVNPNDLITLAYRLGRVVGPLEREGAVIHTVLPREWKGQMPKDLCHRRSRAKLTPAELAIVDAVLPTLGAKAKTDMLDAVALGQWALVAGLWR
jgi:hypothetical protein